VNFLECAAHDLHAARVVDHRIEIDGLGHEILHSGGGTLWLIIGSATTHTCVLVFCDILRR
jgi:hypothetical protein